MSAEIKEIPFNCAFEIVEVNEDDTPISNLPIIQEIDLSCFMSSSYDAEDDIPIATLFHLSK